MRALSIFVMLAIFWAANSGHLDPHHPFLIVVGVICCALTTWLAIRMGCLGRDSNPVPYLGGYVRYAPWLLWQVLIANVDVARRVWSPRLRIDPHMIKVKHGLQSEWGIAAYANSITLTPGTVTVDVDQEQHTFLIHALTDEAAEGLREGSMERHVADVEGSA